ncbi:tRNA pseudouridine synthase Pus10 [Elysia marginata]|uniref:tRNA pseudouridine(55) synthase n=1 Tax=Elysia marginata TaxID=1093978 RepID=A0AAV4J2T9_9GAST|nr:tRNA pseudouridine synthase Pus10 [Elysia marginata]
METFEFFTSSLEECKQIAAALVEVGCCAKCLLRFLGESKSSSYKVSYQRVFDELVPDKNSTFGLMQDCPCPSCLGILQKYADDAFLIKILQKVQEDAYEFSDYQCSLILPVCIGIRQRALYVFLKNKFGDLYSIQEDNLPTVKDVWKWSCGFKVGELLSAQFQSKSAFDIRMTFTYPESDKECLFLLDTFPDVFKKRKQRKYAFETFTRANVAKALDDMSDSKFEDCTSCPPSVPVVECSCEISCTHEPVFVAGRYQKYSRVLSQTPWIVEGKRVMEGSVEELICEQILSTFKPSDHRFSSSGREDVDVRMLGDGRPFIVELIDPHCVIFSKQDMSLLQQKINMSSKDVQVRDLQIVSREDTSILKDGEISKTKCYSAECWCERPLTETDLIKLAGIKDLALQQKTPLRVLHRRTAATRERLIHTLSAEVLSSNLFQLHLNTQAGTYIKEFVHSDFGRTTPSLGELLGAECDIINLDVESVDVDWPPRIDEIEKSDGKAAIDAINHKLAENNEQLKDKT